MPEQSESSPQIRERSGSLNTAYRLLNIVAGHSKTSEIAENLSEARGRAREIVEKSGIMDFLNDGETHIDLGTGPGHILEEIKNKAVEQGKKIKFYGMDLLANPFKSVRNRIEEKAEELNYTPLPRFLRGDARALPFTDQSADSVSLFFVLHHIPQADRERVLLEIDRVLKIGGRFILVEDTSEKEQLKSAKRLDKIANYGLKQKGDNLSADEWKNTLEQRGYRLENSTPFTSKIAGKDIPHTCMVFTWEGKPLEVVSSGY